MSDRDMQALIYQRIAQVSQQAVAQMLGISNSQMSRIVAGEAGITLDRLGALLECLNLQLISGENGNLIQTTENEYSALLYMAEQGIKSLKQRMREEP